MVPLCNHCFCPSCLAARPDRQPALLPGDFQKIQKTRRKLISLHFMLRKLGLFVFPFLWGKERILLPIVVSNSNSPPHPHFQQYSKGLSFCFLFVFLTFSLYHKLRQIALIRWYFVLTARVLLWMGAGSARGCPGASWGGGGERPGEMLRGSEPYVGECAWAGGRPGFMDKGDLK